MPDWDLLGLETRLFLGVMYRPIAVDDREWGRRKSKQLTRMFFWIVLKIENDVLEGGQITNRIAK